MGKQFWKMPQESTEKPTQKVCCLCGGKALYKWALNGYCKAHKAEAVKAATYWIEHKSTPHPMDDLRLYSWAYGQRLRRVEQGAAHQQYLKAKRMGRSGC